MCCWGAYTGRHACPTSCFVFCLFACCKRAVWFVSEGRYELNLSVFLPQDFLHVCHVSGLSVNLLFFQSLLFCFSECSRSSSHKVSLCSMSTVWLPVFRYLSTFLCACSCIFYCLHFVLKSSIVRQFNKITNNSELIHQCDLFNVRSCKSCSACFS